MPDPHSRVRKRRFPQGLSFEIWGYAGSLVADGRDPSGAGFDETCGSEAELLGVGLPCGVLSAPDPLTRSGLFLETSRWSGSGLPEVPPFSDVCSFGSTPGPLLPDGSLELCGSRLDEPSCGDPALFARSLTDCAASRSGLSFELGESAARSLVAGPCLLLYHCHLHLARRAQVVLVAHGR